MKNIIIAIVFFLLGFIVGGGLGINFTLNSAYDSFSKYLEKKLSGDINNVIGQKKEELYLLIEKQKEKIIRDFENKKNEFIENMKEQLKEKLKEEIDNIFGGKKEVSQELNK